MSEKKQPDPDINEVTEAMSKANISAGKKAIVTIGRWQPPHAGHSNLIRTVISDVKREREINERDTVGYIYVSPRPDETRDGGIEEFLFELSRKLPGNVKPMKKLAEILSKNPLTQFQKWYYLNLMYPRLPDSVKFLMVGYPTRGVIASQLLGGFVKESDFNWNAAGKDNGYHEHGIQREDLDADIKQYVDPDTGLIKKGTTNHIVRKLSYRRKQQILKANVFDWEKKTQVAIRKHQHFSPSVTCINYLKNAARVKQIEIVVGSDRVDAFRRYNQGYLDQLPEGGEVRQAGRDRGSVGDQMIVPPVKRAFSLDNEEEEEKVEKAFASCSTADERGLCNSGTDSETKVRDGVFSGTILRNCIKALKCSVEEDIPPLDYFVNGVLVGNMAPLDAFCLFVDIAFNLGYSVPSIEQYNKLVSKPYKIKYKKRYLKGGRKTKKRGRVPIKYVPKRLTRKDKKKARRELKKSRKAYKMGKYYTRKKVKSFKSKKSNHIINAMKIYGVKSVSASPKLAKKSGCSVTGLKKLVSKGAGAYYSSGSRPNQTAISWGRARMASAITGGKAAAVDFKILEKYCKPSSKALKLAKQAKKKHGFGTRKVRKVKL